MAKPKKTKSGKWTIRVYDYQDENGKQYYKRITRDTKAECEYAAAQYRHDERRRERRKAPLTVGQACDKYIELCRTLSPTTVHLYEQLRKSGFQDLMDVPVTDLNDTMLQEAINREANRIGRRGKISAKTLANEWGLVSSALKHICSISANIRLPKRTKNLKEYPEPKQVVDMVRGTDIELPCLLALWLSFSMSEIRGLQFSDIQGDVITINRVLVDVGSLPTLKDEAKTETRKRRHRLPPYLLQLIKEADHSQPFIVPMNQRQIYGRFRRLCQKNGLDLTFHELRHLNASVMLMLNIPEKYAMERGGWSTPHVMRKVYQHTFSAQRQAVDNQVDAYFEGLFSDMTTEHDSNPSGR